MTTPTVPAVAIERVCVEYDGNHVLEDVDLVIEQGDFVALLGPNGSGKSTLIKAMLGLTNTSHGRVRLFGVPLARFRNWERVALVPQRLPGSSNVPVSVWEAVLAGLASPKHRFLRLGAQRRAAALEAIDAVGLSDKLHERLDTLSGGQQRRAMIARALVTNPDLLVMDEPTAGLDAENVETLLEILRALHLAGKTIVVVTHEIEDLGTLVHRAIVLGASGHRSVQFDGLPPVPHNLHDHVHHHDDERGQSGSIGLEA